MIKSTDGCFHIKDSQGYLPCYKNDILSQSIFYPGSGTDSMDLQIAKSDFTFYVHADYRITKAEAEAFLSNVQGIEEYELENIYEFDRSLLFPVDKDMTASWSPGLPLKKSERANFDKFQSTNPITPNTFLMGVYILSETYKDKMVKSPILNKDRELFPWLLVFYFYEDAITLFNALYFHNEINPKAVALFNNIPDRPYWTNLAVNDHRFRLSLLINHLYNHCPMPHFLITDYPPYYKQDNVKRFEWKEYALIHESNGFPNKYLDTERQIYIYDRDILLV